MAGSQGLFVPMFRVVAPAEMNKVDNVNIDIRNQGIKNYILKN